MLNCVPNPCLGAQLARKLLAALQALFLRELLAGEARLPAQRRLRLVLIGSLIVTFAGCNARVELPARSSAEYRNVVSAFHVGLAALQVGDDVRADSSLAEVTKLAPGEPAGWANWGVLALRQRNFDAAAHRLEKARDLAPQNGHMYSLLGILESGRGQSTRAIDNFRKAVDLNPQDLRTAFALAQEIEAQGDKNSDALYQQAIQKILEVHPANLAAQVELSRVAAKRSDADTLKPAIVKIAARSAAWPPEAKEQLQALETAAAGSDLRTAAIRTTFLRNVLMRVADFRASLAELKAPPGEDAQPFTGFLRMESPLWRPAQADTAISFEPTPIEDGGTQRWQWIGAIQMGSAGAPVVAEANGDSFRLPGGAALAFPGGPRRIAPSPEGVLQIDFNYDFKTDLVFAGAGGVRMYRQNTPSEFADVTAQTGLPKSIVEGVYTGAWAVDIEADGDLDVVLGTHEGAPIVLRNNGDGTFAVTRPFAGVSGVRQLAWADFDGDGVPDVAIIDGAGRLHFFANERQGQFRERPLPAIAGTVHAIAVADANNDGILDLLVVTADGGVLRISDRNDGEAWDVAEIARVPDPSSNLAGDVRLTVADLDNNGAMDLVLAPVTTTAAGSAGGALIWLGNEKGGFELLDRRVGMARVFGAVDLNADGKLDLLGLSEDGRPIQLINRGARNYHWQIVRPHAAQTSGDQRINPFGIGGEIEVRAGSLVQKKPITGPRVHFGLGEQAAAEVVRIVWPNGTVRAEFEAKADQEIVAEQRLKGSCPFLFAFNGKQMEFVKDAVPWGSAIGLQIDAVGSASVAATEEWFKIGRDQLAPRDGYYDLRITAELWEVYYYDRLALMTVDHPAGTEIFVDERFVIPPAKLAITVVGTPHRIKSAVDDTGRDVTDIVAIVDGKGLDVGRGQYQGVTRDHYLEVDLGNDVPEHEPVYLLAHGSVYPTDSSINVAMGQGGRWRPYGLRIDVPDGRGGWITVRENQGIPAGRKKTAVLDLTNVFRPGTPRRVRLWTNLEIYWDAIEWAEGRPDVVATTTHLDPTVADLHYRGYSVIDRPDSASPELPDYNRLSGTRQRWRDLIGYYTRFGDVRELLARSDDRYVIMNAGDEMSLRFAEPPPPPAGWLRDFVIVGDGWIKDGDYNSTFSKTVLPLPRHAEAQYTVPPGRLEDEWTYRQHPEDWQNYHTRYVTPEPFMNALRSKARP